MVFHYSENKNNFKNISNHFVSKSAMTTLFIQFTPHKIEKLNYVYIHDSEKLYPVDCRIKGQKWCNPHLGRLKHHTPSL